MTHLSELDRYLLLLQNLVVNESFVLFEVDSQIFVINKNEND